ncbi:beta-lactamase hydrolase domain-containing protein [Tautonia sociabilis]|uniref:Tyrosine specific protein phosphatases domain-containing protein n=1 Tax=Tautonia sociabilis TaxID=2080755 RepID=A0A432MF10_9BACT|nr:sulfur transferase domain-containing protein [Tautonia sociabilis]RUL84339.1 hypothetical protein TsocGM_20645 [Tautonia sociabilis]
MKTERRAATGPPAWRATPRIALIALALATIGLDGCQSLQSINPFRNCNGCGPIRRLGSGIRNGLGSSGGGLFNRNRGQIIYEEPPIVIDSDPGVEVLPGAPAIIEPAPSVGAPLTSPDPALEPLPRIEPPSDSPELELTPLPEPTGRAPQGSINSRTSALRTPDARSTDRAPASVIGSAPPTGDAYADRMARRSSDVTFYRPVAAPDSGNPRGPKVHPLLADDLPSIDSIPAPTAPEPAAPEPAAPGPVEPAASPPAPPPDEGGAPAPVPEPTPPAENSQAAEQTTVIPEPSPTTGAAPGIAAFFSVEPHLAGGSVPAEGGWTTLVERGYRTVLDLRPIDQVLPTDIAASSQAGLRLVLLPTAPGTIDAALVRRFEDEIAQESARPIFFCDTSGTTAAALWFVHLVEAERYDLERARRDAERIAPIPPDLMLAARGYLGLLPSASAGGSPLPESSPPLASADPGASATADPVPTSTPDQPEAAPSPSAVAEAAPPENSTEPGASPTGDPEPEEESIAEVFADPFARPVHPVDSKRWGPYAALFLTILVVPLAYWGSLGIPTGIRTRVRASLMAPARRPRPLPAASGDGT